ncbi:MAG TPA: TetR family transcriptional regulator [Acidimicrobiia bacterium]|nr:TetR family transcriptional regulator [Acidimicrobiia bacterium]
MTGKRRYRLGKRQASVDATKRRILEAASTAYQDLGIDDTSMQEVARRAEVAPGTVLYHYPTPESLADDVVDTWVESMEPPRPDVIDPDEPVGVRITKLVIELFGLYERTGHLYRVYQKSPAHPALVRANAWWEDNVTSMMMRALGERAGDEEAFKVVSVLTNPGFRATLLMTGIDSDRAAEIAAKMAIDWLDD